MCALKKRNKSHNARKDIQLGIDSLSLICFNLYIYLFFFFPTEVFPCLSSNDRTQVCDRSQSCTCSLSHKLVSLRSTNHGGRDSDVFNLGLRAPVCIVNFIQ